MVDGPRGYVVRATRSSAGRIQPGAVVRDTVPLVRAELRGHEVVLTAELGATLPSVLGDQTQLQQEMLNLVMSAPVLQILAETSPHALHAQRGCLFKAEDGSMPSRSRTDGRISAPRRKKQ